MLVKILQYLIGIGVIQAILLGFILLWKPGKNIFISRLTGIVLLLTAMLMSSELIDLFDKRNLFIYLHSYSILLDLLLVVLVWFLSLFILGLKVNFNSKDLLHLIPFVIALFWFHTGFKWYGQEIPGRFSQITDAVALFVGYKSVIWIGYMGSTIRHYIHNKNIKSSLAPTIKKKLFLNLIWPFIIILFISMLSFWLMFFGFNLLIDSDYLGVSLIVCFVYYLSFSILIDPAYFIRLRKIPTESKYKNSNFDIQQSENHVRQLRSYLESEKPYLNTRLSLHDLAQALGLSSNALSYLINEKMGTSFNELINDHRLACFKEKLADPSESRKTLLALALESGFQSKASFNRVFKNAEGITPSTYKRLMLSHPTR